MTGGRNTVGGGSNKVEESLLGGGEGEDRIVQKIRSLFIVT